LRWDVEKGRQAKSGELKEIEYEAKEEGTEIRLRLG